MFPSDAPSYYHEGLEILNQLDPTNGDIESQVSSLSEADARTLLKMFMHSNEGSTTVIAQYRAAINTVADVLLDLNNTIGDGAKLVVVGAKEAH